MMKHIRFSQIAVLFLFLGVIGIVLIVRLAGNRTALQSNAQGANIQVQCSSRGTIQFALSFTNPESQSIDLLADILLQDGTIRRNYSSIAPGKTKTDLVQTNLTSLSNTGDVVFTWYPVTDPTASNDLASSFNPLTCPPVTQLPTPTAIASENQSMDSLLALTPLPSQPEAKPAPFYQTFLQDSGTRVQILIYNFLRFLSTFR